jgi:hypothetical protein
VFAVLPVKSVASPAAPRRPRGTRVEGACALRLVAWRLGAYGTGTVERPHVFCQPSHSRPAQAPGGAPRRAAGAQPTPAGGRKINTRKFDRRSCGVGRTATRTALEAGMGSAFVPSAAAAAVFRSAASGVFAARPTRRGTPFAPVRRRRPSRPCAVADAAAGDARSRKSATGTPAAAPPRVPPSEEPRPLQRFARLAMSLSRPAVFQAALAVTVSVGCALMTPVLLGRTLNALVVASRGPGHAAAQRFLRSLLLVFALFLVECVRFRAPPTRRSPPGRAPSGPELTSGTSSCCRCVRAKRRLAWRTSPK